MQYVKQIIKTEASDFATLDKITHGMLLWRLVGCALYSISIVKKVLSESIVLTNGMVLKYAKNNVYHFQEVPFKFEVDDAAFYGKT